MGKSTIENAGWCRPRVTGFFSPPIRENGVLVTRKISGRIVGKPQGIFSVWSARNAGKPINARRLCAMCRSLVVAPEIIEDTNEVAIKIGGHKLAQLPRFVLRFGNDLRVRGLPQCEEFVHLSLAIEIEPEKDRAHVAVGLPEGAIGDK